MLFTTESTETQWPRLIKIKNRKRKSKQKRGSHDTYYYKTDLQGKKKELTILFISIFKRKGADLAQYFCLKYLQL